jgi:iron complex transport system ATP-binding protein
MIELATVCVSLGGATVLDRVSFRVERGEWVGLLGPNGAGKTTALRTLSGLVRYTGTVRVGGDEVEELGRRELARRIALVPQLPERPPELTVAEYVLLGRTPYLSYFGSEQAADRAAAARALARLELGRFADRSLGSLSGGELQRAVLARALAQEAQILLLDEPTSALDLGRQQQALELVDSLREDGLTIVAAMHDLSLAGLYSDRLVLLDRGAVAADGSAAEVLSPANIAGWYGASVKVVEEDGAIYVLPYRG